MRTYALEWVVRPPAGAMLHVLGADDAGRPPRGLDSARIEEGIDAPFSVFRPSPERSVHVRIEFIASAARYVLNRRWHRRQRFTQKPDGRALLELGPVSREEVEAWVRSWGAGARMVSMRPARRGNRAR